jgi:hypothetical protein
MKLQFLIALPLLVLAACASEPGTQGSVDTEGTGSIEDADKLELAALQRIGDVRVTWFQKAGLKESWMRKGTMVEQQRQLRVLVNQGHSWYAGVNDYTVEPEVTFLHSSDMHDLLVILRDQCEFFDKGRSVNIGGDDPVKRADREASTDKVIAVQQIKDGKVNTSYFAFRDKEPLLDEQRAKKFNEAQGFVLMAIGKSVPRGTTGVGESKGRTMDPRRER